KNFLKKTLHRFSPADTLRWFEERGVSLKAEADGRMFPITDHSQTIIDALTAAMQRNKTIVHYHKSVTRIEPAKEGQLKLYFSDQTTYTADKVLVACGGFPKKEQYHWLLQLGHSIQEP